MLVILKKWIKFVPDLLSFKIFGGTHFVDNRRRLAILPFIFTFRRQIYIRKAKKKRKKGRRKKGPTEKKPQKIEPVGENYIFLNRKWNPDLSMIFQGFNGGFVFNMCMIVVWENMHNWRRLILIIRTLNLLVK